MLPFAVFVICSLHAAEVARVGDAVITPEALRQTVARDSYNIYDEGSVKRGLGDAVQFELLAAEAKKLGLDKEPAVARQMKELLVQKLLAEKVDNPLLGAGFSQSDLRAYYDAHTNEFRRPALARGYVLTLLAPQGKQPEPQLRAKEALEQLKEAKSPETIVKKYSDDPSERLNGGLSSFFVEGKPGRRYPPAVEQAMLGLNPCGAVVGPITTPRALYLIRLAERRDAQLTPFDQARPEVQKRLFRDRRQKAIADYCEGLRKEFPVTIDETQLKATVEPSKPGAGPPRGPVDVP